MDSRHTTNINFILSGICFLAISAMLGWLFNSVVYGVVQEGGFVAFSAIGYFVWFIPVTLLNRYGLTVATGRAKYFQNLNLPMLKFTTFILFVVGILISLLFFSAKYMDGLSDGIPQGSTLGYIITMIVSYIASAVIDYVKRHPLRGGE